MKIKRRHILYGIALFFICLFIAVQLSDTNKGHIYSGDNGFKRYIKKQNKDSFIISKPYSFRNLQIYLIEQISPPLKREFISLESALQSNRIVVYESEIINKLYISNRSDKTVYINTGEILKGGKQDRAIQHDLIIPPNAQNIEAACLCVERDRWAKRSLEESDKHFSSSTKLLSSTKLKKAVVLENSQSSLWGNIGQYQFQVNQNLMHFYDVKRSEIKNYENVSSLELTLDEPALNRVMDDIKSKLGEFMELDKANGIAVVINGELKSIDLYGSSAIFRQLFDKLIEAAIYESVGEARSRDSCPFDKDEIKNALISETLLEHTDHNNRNISYESYFNLDGIFKHISIDRYSRQWIHQSYLFD